MNNKINSRIFISPKSTAQAAYKKLEIFGKRVLLVVNRARKLLGTLTDGDLRVYVITKKNLNATIEKIFNPNPFYLDFAKFSMEKARKLFLENVLDLIPILDEKHRVIDYITWHQAFSEKPLVESIPIPLDNSVVIMAGGMGTRLEPFTKIIPKPLIPIGDKPVVEIIIDEFRKSGISDFFFTLNYKADIIESYFRGLDKDYKIHYVREKDFLGTAGSLSLLRDKLNKTFIVSNCDVIVKADFRNILDFHRDKRAVLTIISSIQNYRIPYGVLKTRSGGRVANLIEKPEYTFNINSGVYVLEPEALDLVAVNTNFDMPTLIKKLITKGKPVFVFPVTESQYIDIGQWDEFQKAATKLSL